MCNVGRMLLYSLVFAAALMTYNLPIWVRVTTCSPHTQKQQLTSETRQTYDDLIRIVVFTIVKVCTDGNVSMAQ